MYDVASLIEEDRLLIENVAKLFGFDRLSSFLPGPDVYPPYLFVGFFLLILDHGVIQTYIHLTGGTHGLVANPIIFSGVIAAFLGIYGIRYMSNKYERAIDDSRVDERVDNTDDYQAFERPISFRTKVVVLALSVAVLYANIVLNVGVATLIENRGGALPLQLVNWLFVFQFVYLPVVVEFGLIYFSIHFLLPYRIKQIDLPLFFYDPRNMGGFSAIGQLLKRSYYVYTAGLIGFFLLVYGGVILSPDSNNVPGLFEFVFFSGAWSAGLASIGHSMYVMHQVMADKKRECIADLEEQMHDVIEKPYDINESRITNSDQFQDITDRLERVRNTRVYPATFTMWSQIAISVLLPQALQLIVQTV